MNPWLLAALGGALFGTATGLLLVGHGRIGGVSGIAAGLMHGERSERAWRAVLLLALLAGAAIAALFRPEAIARHYSGSLSRVLLAGLLIGIGARLANGCTSGHGVAGIGRLSMRSIVATSLFTLAGGLAHWVMPQ